MRRLIAEITAKSDKDDAGVISFELNSLMITCVSLQKVDIVYMTETMTKYSNLR